MCFKELEESFKDHCGIFGIYRTDKSKIVPKLPILDYMLFSIGVKRVAVLL